VPAYLLGEELVFPPPEGATREGVVAIGGDLRPERILLGYSQGIFPWPSPGLPLLWFSPHPRWVIEPEKTHVARSLRKRMRKADYEVRCDTAFDAVIRACSAAPRPGQDGTWITDEMITAYGTLHRQGFAHSIECWMQGQLVGGLYGVSLGRAFFGESMFAVAPDASKIAFATLCGNLAHWGFSIVDCQVKTEHLARFGAVAWPRKKFLTSLRTALEAETRKGPWQFELTPLVALGRLRTSG
jgi:leucyl/phenylalanyl-tRNA--protein transferase